MSKPKPDEKSLIETVLMLAESEIDSRRACGGEGVEEADGLEEEIKRARPLIEAAPDLLEALEGMLEWARRVKQINPGSEVVNASSAIKKATGGNDGER